tara:strand:+ start:98 stop:367 length:270 start_codon:yes stop_codon:yes gene_type:complete
MANEPEYKFNCRECGKPDKEFPLHFSDYEVDEPIYNAPRIKDHMWARFDAYGIYTELCCDECYENGNYSYKKNRYFDPAYAGERLEPDE